MTDFRNIYTYIVMSIPLLFLYYDNNALVSKTLTFNGIMSNEINPLKLHGDKTTHPVIS